MYTHTCECKKKKNSTTLYGVTVYPTVARKLFSISNESQILIYSTHVWFYLESTVEDDELHICGALILK